jgi:hypothetical protein
VKTQCETLLAAFRRGESLTVAEALSRYGVYALSQRVGELIAAGHPIDSETVRIGRSRVSRYFLRESVAA